MHLFYRLLVVAGITALIVYAVAFWPLRDPHPTATVRPGTLAIADVRLYATPQAAPVDHATVVVRDGRIVAAGAGVEVPAGAEMLPCAGCTVVAGYWNAHVHFTQAQWSGAERRSAAELDAALTDMLTSRGFTTVVDLGSNLRDTIPLRRRIEHGELAGPRIYTAGGAQYPPHGIPYYLRDTLPRWLLWFLDQPATPVAAERTAERNIANGADLLKLFTGSYVAPGTVLPMPLGNARAATAVAHAHHQLVFAHESNAVGVEIARDAGVDVLAHAADNARRVDDALLASLVAHHIAMVPTLYMFARTVTRAPEYLDPIDEEVRRFHALGGTLLFGTDVGYLTDYDTTGEFEALARCGLGGRDILAMLTTAPAERFGVAADTGTVEAGKAGDLVVLDHDPLEDPRAFAAVRYTVRGGRVLFRHR